MGNRREHAAVWSAGVVWVILSSSCGTLRGAGSAPLLQCAQLLSRVSSCTHPLHLLGVLVSFPALYGFIAATPCSSEEVSWT